MRANTYLAAAMLGFALDVWSPVSAQNLGPGETPYISALYKASHNSYARDESLAQQLDDYNIWQIELDINEYQLKLFVAHDCGPPSDSDDTLDALLQRLVDESTTYRQKFTMIYLDMKQPAWSSCEWTVDLPGHLKHVFTGILGNHIYPASEFIQKDQKNWPSYQALVRRGYNWAIIVDWHGTNLEPSNSQTGSDDLFFYATEDNPPLSRTENRPSDNTVLVNIDGGCDGWPTDSEPQLRDDRWIYRGYPGAGCATNCQELNGNYWKNLVQKRFNYLATNCVNWDHTFDAVTKSPQPLFVDASASINCPNGYAKCDWGTSRYPFHNLGPALRRADPVTTVRIKPGDYQLSTPAQVGLIDRPATLVDDGPGPVTIR